MPAWETVDLEKLNGALAAPRRSAFGKDAYPSFADKAAILAYSMIKAHAWANGNKRMGLISTMLFAALNEMWWDVIPEDARAHVTWIAASESRCFPEALAYLKKYFARKIVPFAESGTAKAIGITTLDELVAAEPS
jgi:prophage maintenance system killer protein